MNDINNKSVLAKLLAKEDITIVHDPKMPTAAFDVKNRNLYLPVFKKMSSDLYDLFIGHEVGHAHFTPEEGWHDAVCDNPSLKGFYNVIEDARIERKIKEMYPGLSSNFYKGYKELFDKDFFGIADKDVNKLPLVDRINIHFKLGHLAGVQFKDTEQEFVDRIAKAETWDDVKALSNELAEKSAEEAKEKQEEAQELKDLLDELKEKMGDIQESQGERPADSETDEWNQRYEMEQEAYEAAEDEDGNVPEDFEFDRYSDEITEKVKEKVEKAEKEIQDFEEKQAEIDKLKEEIADVEDDYEFHEKKGQHSQTDSNFRKNEIELLDENAKDNIYMNLGTDINVSDVIIEMDELYDWEHCAEVSTRSKWDNENGTYIDGVDLTKDQTKALGKTLAKQYIDNNQPIINQMAQQFELKKAATGFKKARISKTGKLNEDKLWAYKLTEDLFQQTQVVPNGKNHGIIMYVDMSGSMYQNMEGTIEQAINVALFCRKVGIPFDVYGFSDAGRRRHQDDVDPIQRNMVDLKEGDYVFQDTGFRYVQLLSSRAKKSSWDNALAYLMIMMKGYSNRYDYDSDEVVYIHNTYFNLSGTPLNTAVALAPEMAKAFTKAYNVEKLSTIFLTDGGATDNVNIFKEKDDQGRIRCESTYGKKLNIRIGAQTVSTDQESGYGYRNEADTNVLLEAYKIVSGSRLFNFHIVKPNKREFFNEYRRIVKGSDYMDEEWEKGWYKDLLKNKFNSATPKFGFDTVLLIKGQKDLEVGVQELEVKSNSKGDLMRGFRNFNKNKKSSRTFVNQVIELVA